MTVQMDLYQYWDRVLETVLIIDDDPDDVLALKSALKVRRPDAQLVAFATLEDARRFVEKGRPDMIFLDHHLPDGWGGDLALELKDRPALADVPIFVITGEPLVSLDYRVIALSKDDLDSETLSALIADFLRMRREAHRQDVRDLARIHTPEGGRDVAKCLSAAVREIRTARAQVTRSAPLGAIRQLEQAEDKLAAAIHALEQERMA